MIELQKLDCNCNDCGFMIRDSERLKESKQFHRQLDKDAFDRTQGILLQKAMQARRENELEKFEAIHKTRDKMKFQPSYVSGLNYGTCSKFSKPVSFIAMTCQPENSECFTHRKDMIPK